MVLFVHVRDQLWGQLWSSPCGHSLTVICDKLPQKERLPLSLSWGTEWRGAWNVAFGRQSSPVGDVAPPGMAEVHWTSHWILLNRDFLTFKWGPAEPTAWIYWCWQRCSWESADRVWNEGLCQWTQALLASMGGEVAKSPNPPSLPPSLPSAFLPSLWLWGSNRGLAHARQTLYHWATFPAPKHMFLRGDRRMRQKHLSVSCHPSIMWWTLAAQFTGSRGMEISERLTSCKWL
jgi:hypothetical protein